MRKNTVNVSLQLHSQSSPSPPQFPFLSSPLLSLCCMAHFRGFSGAEVALGYAEVSALLCLSLQLTNCMCVCIRVGRRRWMWGCKCGWMCKYVCAWACNSPISPLISPQRLPAGRSRAGGGRQGGRRWGACGRYRSEMDGWRGWGGGGSTGTAVTHGIGPGRRVCVCILLENMHFCVSAD